MKSHILASLNESRVALNSFIEDDEVIGSIQRAGEVLVETFKSRGRVLSCGNGGSLCDAMHFAEELTGRYRKNRPALAATAIGDGSHLTCVGNDYGYEYVFSRYVEAHMREGDCLVALSTSGMSRNVVLAAEAARAAGGNVIALTGKHEGPLADLSTVHICAVGGKYADRVQELHIKVLHILIELVERKLFPANYEGE